MFLLYQETSLVMQIPQEDRPSKRAHRNNGNAHSAAGGSTPPPKQAPPQIDAGCSRPTVRPQAPFEALS
jgi:hypothetical protein